MSCTTCSLCFRQADGSVVKREQFEGAFIYYLPDGSRTTVMPASFINTDPVDCSLYNNQVAPTDHEMQIFCEVDANGDATGVRVMSISYVDPVSKDPSVVRYNMADMSEWTGDPTTLTTCGTDGQVESDAVAMCDEGVEFLRWIVKEKGEPTGESYDTDLAGNPYTPSANAVARSCSELVEFDYEPSCFRDPSNIDNLKISGSVRYQTASSTGASTIDYIDDDGNVLDKSLFVKVPCC